MLLKLFFCPTSNNLTLKICCKDIIKILWISFLPFLLCKKGYGKLEWEALRGKLKENARQCTRCGVKYPDSRFQFFLNLLTLAFKKKCLFDEENGDIHASSNINALIAFKEHESFD